MHIRIYWWINPKLNKRIKAWEFLDLPIGLRGLCMSLHFDMFSWMQLTNKRLVDRVWQVKRANQLSNYTIPDWYDADNLKTPRAIAFSLLLYSITT